MLLKLYNRIKNEFEGAGIHPAATEARIVIKEVLGYDRQGIVLNPDVSISAENIKTVEETMKLRIGGRPLSKIFDKNEFWGLPFKVTDDTLDPRQDSETLIETALEYFTDQAKAIKILDIGTGTGCLIITLLSEYTHARGLAIDISEQALNVASENAEQNQVHDRLVTRNCGWNDLGSDQLFDLIVSNPPYIDQSDIPDMQREVLQHDPHLALFAEEHGLKAYREIAEIVPGILNDDGYLILEIGCEQAESVKQIFRGRLEFCALKQDLASRDRCLIFKKV